MLTPTDFHPGHRPEPAAVDPIVNQMAVLMLQMDEVARRLPAMTRSLKSSTVRALAGCICDLSEVLNLTVSLGRPEEEFERDVEHLLSAIGHLALLLAKSRHGHELAFAVRLARSIAARIEACGKSFGRASDDVFHNQPAAPMQRRHP